MIQKVNYTTLITVYYIKKNVRINKITIFPALATAPKEEEEKENKKTIDIGKEAAIEAEVRAARERAIVPLETRIKSFRDMLAEKDVNKYKLISNINKK